MKTRLTSQQIQSYRNNGFVLLPDFLNANELAEWRGAVDEAVRERAGQRLDDGRPDGVVDDSFYANVFIQSINLWKTNARVKALVLDPRLGKVAATLAGIDGIRVWHDQALIKRPWDNATAWHLDDPYWSFTSQHSLSLWLALDDATLENGCLYFLPGTHQRARYDEATARYVHGGIGQNMNELFKVYPDWRAIPSVAVPMKAGSCSFHNGLLGHGAGANMTPGWRRAMTIGFMPDGSTFNGQQNVLPKEYFQQLKPGAVLNDDTLNPLVWSKPG